MGHCSDSGFYLSEAGCSEGLARLRFSQDLSGGRVELRVKEAGAEAGGQVFQHEQVSVGEGDKKAQVLLSELVGFAGSVRAAGTGHVHLRGVPRGKEGLDLRRELLS